MLIKVHTVTTKNVNPEILIKLKTTAKIILKFANLDQLAAILENMRGIQFVNAKIIICDKNKIISNNSLKKKILEKIKINAKLNLSGIAKILYKHLDNYKTNNYKQLIKELSPIELSDSDALEIIKIIAK